MKRLKFSEPSPKLVLEGKKDTTWRVNDEKGISAGETISLCRTDGKEFAKAKVVSARESNFGDLSKEKAGYEKIRSKDMYRTYSNYYKMKVMPATRVKVIKFRLCESR